MASGIDSGAWVVRNVDGKALLKALLEKLNIPEESQLWFFSKTSLQNSLINQRILKNCRSYMIYSLPFKGPPKLVKERV